MVDISRFVLRIPRDVHDDLKRIAAAEDRSLHNQILRFLRAAIETWKAEHPES